ncbi:hypothetical protein ASG52_05390 [Methylobacterium sp. Leaf456]|uniref:hypothetical protein n=1 Tax=Methylobacterium sp. Leaf456 TaxID=1736382 RepID=UPI0006FB8E46|nr:hypothetical protein [Methylobacterium sp. Leaf456]KQT53550.1 hypothetical protein ASG52_05390 [Methylobacterium sp. Leaf456]
MDSLTELQNLDGKCLAKRIGLNEAGEVVTQPYERGAYRFRAVEHHVLSIYDLASTLDRIGACPGSCVIRGKPLYPELLSVRRLKTLFKNVPRRWVLLDCDGIAYPPGLDWRCDPEAAVRFVVSLLPAAFHAVTCWWAFSASQGFKEGLRLRLAFWLDRPVFGDELTLWLAERRPEHDKPRRNWQPVSPVDPVVFRTVQPIYVARPILGPGVVDPVPRRSGLLVGSRDAVSVPTPIEARYSAMAAKVAKPATGKASAIPREVVTAPYGPEGSGYAYHLDSLGDGPGGAGFHAALLSAAGAWVAAHGPDASTAEVQAEMAAAARAAHRDPAKHSAEDVEQRIAGLPAMFEWVQGEERRRRARQLAPGQLCAAPDPLPTMSRSEASSALESATRDAMALALAAVERRRTHGPMHRFLEPFERLGDPQTGIKATAGLGKSTAICRHISKATLADPTLRIVVAAPTQALVSEWAQALNLEAGRTIAKPWLGTGQPNPTRPEQRACRKHDLVAVVQATGGAIRDVCGGPDRGWCGHNPNMPGQRPENACCYRRQFDRQIPVWIVTHAQLAHAAPPPFHTAERKRASAACDLLIIDEAPWLSLYGGFDARATKVLVPDLVDPLRWFDGSSSARDEYGAISRRLIAGLQGQAGLLKRQELLDAGLTPSLARKAVSLAQAGRRRIVVRHDLPADEAAAAARIVSERRGAAPLVVRFWQLVADLLSGPNEIAPWTLYLWPEGDGPAAVQLRWKEELHPDWAGGPVIYLDATLIPEVARQWLPRLQVVADIQAAETEGVRRIAITDRKNGKSSLVGAPGDGADEAEHDRRANKRDRYLRLFEVLAFRNRGRGRRGGPDVAIGTYQDIENEFRSRLPANVEVGHFNAMRGSNRWGAAGVMAVFGRPEASPRHVEQLASVASGQLVPAISGWYPTTEGILTMRDGTGRAVSAYAHPNPLAEAFRQQVVTEVLQMEARGRAIRRTGQHDRLDSYLLTSTPTGLLIDEVVTEDELLARADTIALLAARGVVPDHSGDAAACLPDLFGDSRDPAAAFRKRQEREGVSLADLFEHDWQPPGLGARSCDVSLRVSIRDRSQLRGGPIPRVLDGILPEGLAGFDSYRYRPESRRTGSLALIDAAFHPDPEAALSVRTGPLAIFGRAPRPPWLAEIHSIFDPAERSPVPAGADILTRLQPAASTFATILGTGAHQPSAILPLADELYRIGTTRMRVHRFCRADHGSDLWLRQRSGASWPPRAEPIVVEAKPAAVPTVSGPELARELGKPARAYMAGATFKRLQREHGTEQALVLCLVSKHGREAVLAAAQRCFARRGG